MGASMNTLHGRVRTAEKQVVESRTHYHRFEVRVESDEISFKAVHQVIHVFLGHGGVYHQVRRRRRSVWIIHERVDSGASERERCEFSPDVMRDWIGSDHVFEPAGIDLVIIGGVAPATNAVR